MTDTLFVFTIVEERADLLTDSTESIIEMDEEMIASILVKGHYWKRVEDGNPALVRAYPILSGGSSGFGQLDWDTYVPGENEQIGCVGQTMKQVTHLIATVLAPAIGEGQLDMSFDHVFYQAWRTGD